MRWTDLVKETVIKLGYTKPEPDSPSMKMMSEIDSKFNKNPMNEKQYIIGDAKVELSAVRNTIVRISDIESMKKGSGTKAMELICDLADKYKTTIELTAFGYSDTPTDALVSWYKKFGFFAKNEDDDDGVDMARHPN